jgi:glutamyl-tRNA synthetase
MVRTRIAPSPTGEDIHIGNLYTALMNYAWAKKNNGEFIVRVEDTDRERLVGGAEERILGSLHAYGLMPDESVEKGGPYAPYRQSERLALYKKFADELIVNNKAYYCFCTKDRLDALRKQQIAEKKTPRYDKHCMEITDYELRVKNGEPYVIRLNVPPNETVAFQDVIRGEISFDTNNIDDQVLIKSDGFPTYHMAVVVDDHLMKITHVIRAEEWISSTPKHILLYKAFEWELPIFAHLPILRNPDKSKLSKRKNPVWARWYLEEGFLPEAVLNYLALMGWSHPNEQEIFSLSEFIQLIELADIKPVGPVFDLVKLRWMNQQYIQHLTDEQLKEKLKDFYKGDQEIMQVLDDQGAISSGLVVGLAKTRMETLKDFKTLMLEPEVSYRDENEREIAGKLSIALNDLESWNKDQIFTVFKSVMNDYGIRMPVLYYIFTGKERGLPLPEVLEGLGKEKTLQRLTS